ncbi:hypothetical protein [Phytohabitans suffuscus]|uniref:hypothetical protein n=1 Tax=Phytohabitans suffuscus TaxID=624315 RepID=UPI001E5A39B4|nr:hypothetical protein [Phytohabitans suffuscus]
MAVAGLGCDEGLKLGSLGFQTERLVVLVGGAADVDRDAAHAAAFDLPNVTGAARFLAHGYHPMINTDLDHRTSLHPEPSSSRPEVLENANQPASPSVGPAGSPQSYWPVTVLRWRRCHQAAIIEAIASTACSSSSRLMGTTSGGCTRIVGVFRLRPLVDRTSGSPLGSAS